MTNSLVENDSRLAIGCFTLRKVDNFEPSSKQLLEPAVRNNHFILGPLVTHKRVRILIPI